MALLWSRALWSLSKIYTPH